MNLPSVSMSDLSPTDSEAIEQVAQLVFDAFREHSPWLPDLRRAREEGHGSFEEGRVSRIVRDENGMVLGWVGAIPDYDGNVWEIHPLAVRLDVQRGGLGRLLLADIEARAAEHGVTTLYLGTDDEDGRTSLTDLDPYPDALIALAGIKNVGDHPFEFYQKCGFVIVGMLPDTNGPGKPDIFMAKRVRGGAS